MAPRYRARHRHVMTVARVGIGGGGAIPIAAMEIWPSASVRAAGPDEYACPRDRVADAPNDDLAIADWYRAEPDQALLVGQTLK